MAEHKLYRQFESTSPFISSMIEDISPVRHVRPNIPNAAAHVKYNNVQSKSADKRETNEKTKNKTKVTDKETNLNISDFSSQEDWDSDDFNDNYSIHGPKLPYSAREDEWILKFVLKGQNIFKVGSISLWKHLESKKENPKRTYQSLKNRFLRSIKPHLFTRYRHLIASNAEVEKILTKFPELKCKVGRTKTLSRLELPARNPDSNFDGLVNGSRKNDERVTSPRAFTSEAPPRGSTRREPTLNFHFSNFERKVTITDKSLAIRVNFVSKEQLHKPFTPSIGIYEKYKKFKKKNKLVLCTSCGRYNQPKKNKLLDSGVEGESVNVSAERHVLTPRPSGPDPGKSSATNSGSPPAKHRKTAESLPLMCAPLSPSLLNDGEEEHDVPIGWGTPPRPPEIGEGRTPETPNSVASKRKAGSPASQEWRETDDDLDLTCDSTVTDLRRLIDHEEERLLVRKCLFGKGGVLGLSDSLSQMSMEAFFVELSPNLESPELTIDYSSQSQRSQGSERGNPSSLLARNMMKMLENGTPKES